MTAISHVNDSFRMGLPRFQTLNMYKMKNGSAKHNTSFKANSASGTNGYSGLNSIAGTSGGRRSSYSSLPPGDASETTWLGYTIDVDEDVFGETWEQVDELPGYYELKDGIPLTWMGIEPDLEFRFYHAAESTEDDPILIARGADGHGRVFEQKIHLNRINPYNATRMEMNALTTYYEPENKYISIPFLDYCDNPKMDKRFDYINGLRSAITASRTLGFVRQARQYQGDIDFLLKVTKNQASPNAAELNLANDKRNLELCTSAVRERFLSNLSRKCSDNDLLEQFWS